MPHQSTEQRLSLTIPGRRQSQPPREYALFLRVAPTDPGGIVKPVCTLRYLRTGEARSLARSLLVPPGFE